jgi:hypothetical protein
MAHIVLGLVWPLISLDQMKSMKLKTQADFTGY